MKLTFFLLVVFMVAFATCEPGKKGGFGRRFGGFGGGYGGYGVRYVPVVSYGGYGGGYGGGFGGGFGRGFGGGYGGGYGGYGW